MTKQSKITVKHYLNTRLKPEIEDELKIYPLYLSITYDRMNIRTPSHINNGLYTAISETDFIRNKIEKKILFKMNYEIDLIKRCVEIFQSDEHTKQIKKNYHLLYSLKNYRSKNERLNIFNSYIDFWTHSVYEVVSDFLYNEIKTAVTEVIKSDLKGLDLLDNFKMKMLFHPNNPELYDLIVKFNLGLKVENYFILWSRFHSYLAEQGNKFGYDMAYIDWKQCKAQPFFKSYLKSYTRSTDKWGAHFFNDELIENYVNTIEKIINNENYFNKAVKIYNK